MDVLATHGKARAWPALAGFMLDLLLAVLLLLALTLFCGLAWAVARGVQLGIGGADLANLPVLVNDMGPPSAIATIWMTLVSTGGAAVIMYAWRHRATQAERLQSRQAAGRVDTWGWVVLTGVATFIFSAALSLLGERYGIRPQPSNLPLIQAAANASPVFMMLFGVLIAPAYEELLFRRVLFGRLWAAGKPWLGVFLSSAAFALMHEIPGVGGNSWQATGLLWAVYGFMGAAFAMLYWRTRTLWACIGAHALNNVIALTLLSLSATA
ncbi:MAG: CPBP family intramembrane metalloprotease [Burkholderiales bacterium]|nr:MAG: CPBP family intramembrane metalloprotease [Burkholderiales bacterium]